MRHAFCPLPLLLLLLCLGSWSSAGCSQTPATAIDAGAADWSLDLPPPDGGAGQDLPRAHDLGQDASPGCDSDADCGAGQRCVGRRCVDQIEVWPNSASAANSAPWLMQHHDTLRQMRPRILALNFVNAKTNAQMVAHLAQITAAWAEASRFHGYRDPQAPPFLQPEVAYAIDLRDDPPPAGWPYRNSTHYPRESTKQGTWSLDYEQLFTRRFAWLMDIHDPADTSSDPLDLCQLINRGLVHEVWLYGDGDLSIDVVGAEILELKPHYDMAGNRLTDKGMNRCAGNGCFDQEDAIPPHCTRTVRIGWVNQGRGPGCFLESLSHGFETIGARKPTIVPYLASTFPRFAGFDLNKQYQLPLLQGWYACPMGKPCLSYPTPTSVSYTINPLVKGTLQGYDPVCGNVHFAPNARTHYDQLNTETVLTSCQHYGEGGGAGGSDPLQGFSWRSFAQYRDLAQDCQGPFLVWWWQNMPGRDNNALDLQGQPMHNWLPYIYY